MVRYTTGETFQDRSKGKDVRTSNIVAAKVRLHMFLRNELCAPFLKAIEFRTISQFF